MLTNPFAIAILCILGFLVMCLGFYLIVDFCSDIVKFIFYQKKDNMIVTKK